MDAQLDILVSSMPCPLLDCGVNLASLKAAAFLSSAIPAVLDRLKLSALSKPSMLTQNLYVIWAMHGTGRAILW